VAIPTYARESVLISTLEHVLAMTPVAGEILVVDRTPRHHPAVEAPTLAERISAAARATALTYTRKNSCESLVRFYEQLLDGKQAAKASC
jgi:hypothetical protein